MDYAEQLGIEERLKRQIDAYHEAALAYTCITLRLPETMGTESWTVDRLAAALDLSAPHLLRTLRGLASLGLVGARDGDSFALTELGRALAPGAASNLREKLLIVVEQYWQPWANLDACIQTGRPSFDAVFGMPVGAWRREHQEHGEAFDTYLARESFVSAGPVVEALRLTRSETVADIGGGHGGFLAAVLKAAPNARGVLFDQPHSVAAAEPFLQSMGVADRVQCVAGDILEDIPVEADTYVLKSVLQQHDDVSARTILDNCRKAMKPGATLAIYERLMPENATDDPAAVMLDLHMMAIYGGRVRTKTEMMALLAEAGLAVAEVSETDDGLAVIEAHTS